MKICHVYEADNRNYGDVIIGECMQRLMKKFLRPDEIVTVPATRGYETPDFRLNTAEVVEKANESDFCIIGGGGILTFLLDGRIPTELISKPFVVYSCGWNGWYNETLLRETCLAFKPIEKRALFFSVRMDGTHRFCKDIKFRSSPDPANFAGLFFNRLPHPLKEDYVLFCIASGVANFRYEVNGKTLGEVHWAVRKAVEHVNDLGLKAVFIAHRTADTGCYESVKDLNVRLVNWEKTMENFKLGLSYYKYAQLVVSTRGHSQIIPYGYQIPQVNISTQPKNEGFMKVRGLEQYCIHAKDLNERRLNHTIDRAMLFSHVFRKDWKSYFSQLWVRTMKQWKFIQESVNLLSEKRQIEGGEV